METIVLTLTFSRHGEHSLRLRRRQRHDPAAESEGVQSRLGRGIPNRLSIPRLDGRGWRNVAMRARGGERRDTNYRTIKLLTRLSPENELQSTNAHAKKIALSLSAVDISSVEKETESRVECRVLMKVDFPDSIQ